MDSDDDWCDTRQGHLTKDAIGSCPDCEGNQSIGDKSAQGRVRWAEESMSKLLQMSWRSWQGSSTCQKRRGSSRLERWSIFDSDAMPMFFI